MTLYAGSVKDMGEELADPLRSFMEYAASNEKEQDYIRARLEKLAEDLELPIETVIDAALKLLFDLAVNPKLEKATGIGVITRLLWLV